MKTDNPKHYRINHDLAAEIWEVLYKEGYPFIANSLSELMIEQGCQSVKTKDAHKILAFWQKYLEKIDILNLKKI